MSGTITRVNNDIIETYQGQDVQGDVGDSGVMSALAEIAIQVKSNGTDDTQAIQNAINTISSNGGGTLLLPDNLYIIKDTTTEKGIKPCSNLRVIGGQNTTLKLGASRCNIFSNYVDDFTINGYGTLNNVTFENLIFDGDYHNISDPATSNLDGDNYGYGVYIVRAKNIKIKNCKFYRHWYGGYNLFAIDGQLVENNYFEDCCNLPNAESSTGYHAMGADGSYNAASRNVMIQKNKVVNCAGLLRANGGVGNGQVQESNSWIIKENESFGTPKGIDIYGGWYTDVDIVGNKLRDVQYRALCISGNGQSYSRSTPVSNVRIENNKLRITSATTQTNTALIYGYSTDILSISNNQIIATVDIPSTVDLIVAQPEYNGTAVIPFISTIEGNEIKINGIRHIFNLSTGLIKILGNIVNAGAVSGNVINSSNTVDLRVAENDFVVISGSIWNKTFKTRVWRNNIGFKTHGMLRANVHNSKQIAHGIGTAPTIILITIMQDANYIVTATADATNITFVVRDTTGTVVNTDILVACEYATDDYYANA